MGESCFVFNLSGLHLEAWRGSLDNLQQNTVKVIKDIEELALC